MAKVLSGAGFAQGLQGEKLIVTGSKARNEYQNNQPTGKIESARVDVVGQNVGNVHIDLVPYTEDNRLVESEAIPKGNMNGEG